MRVLLSILLTLFFQLTHAQIYCSCLSDSDDDGIIDCFDICPDSQIWIRVDSHGCPRDTDGDGVPDFKDKELITPTECQPSDSDGLGHCNYSCCEQPGRRMDYFPDRSLFLQGMEEKVSPSVKDFLDRLITLMKANPNFPVVLKIGKLTKSDLQKKLAQNRLRNYANYMVSQGIDIERIALKIEIEGLNNILLVRWNDLEFETIKRENLKDSLYNK